MYQWRVFILIFAAGLPSAFGQQVSSIPDSIRAGSKPVKYVLPVLSYAQETSLQLGLHGLYAFKLPALDSITRSSSISATAFYTLKKQVLGQVQADIWLPGNTWHYQAEFSYRYFPFYFYGTGNNTAEQDKESVNEKRALLHLTAERRMAKHYYAGIQKGIETYRYSPNRDNSQLGSNATIFGKNGGNVWFTEFMQVFDSRDDLSYTRRGVLFKTGLRYLQTFAATDPYQGWMWHTDARAFSSLTSKIVLGFQAAFRQYLSKTVPFYLMHQLGGDQLMRGYYIGRYRDNGFIASQVELRYMFSREIGFVGFGGGGFVFGKQAFSYYSIKPSWGGGLRYSLRGDERLTLRLDYGIGAKEPGEKRQSGFYFSIGQAF